MTIFYRQLNVLKSQRDDNFIADKSLWQIYTMFRKTRTTHIIT
jgi:hypothetical protein